MKVNGVELCVESFGVPTDPAILLIHGAGHSLLAWEDDFVGRLVAGGRYVTRFDSRDAGLSTTFPVGEPGYGLADLVTDAAGVIAGLGLTGGAHVVGMSQGAAVSQLLALDHPDLVASLTLASSTPGGPGHDQPDLPGMTEELRAVFAADPGTGPDWTDEAAVIEYLVGAERPFMAEFDEDAVRRQSARIVGRSSDIAAQLTNPFLIDAGAPWRDRLGRISAPTLVLHGAEDPLFPLAHGRALAAEIPGARFLELARTGHEVFPRSQWDVVVPALLEHTAR
ncbi:alpha/beta hydrolase [Longispora sp. K20-0274]|uniref:alpha/beta fold hydrolase n=1 Tax=Longispora sp. K20-0274 TaxID=3088255 RepID=UPI00399BC36E